MSGGLQEGYGPGEVPQLSLVVPAKNEEANLQALIKAIREALDPVCTWELILVDDGSTDASRTLLSDISLEDSRIRCIRFSRSFGKEAAIQAGLAASRGQAVAVMDADLQHPPSVLPAMFEAWRTGGADVVDGVKRNRGTENRFYRWAAGFFNRLMSGAGLEDMQGASDFKLLDRRVADTIAAFPERSRFFRGLTGWAGFRHVRIDYDVAPRHAGRSTWTVRDLMRYSLSNLVSFSSAPLRAISTLGFVTVLFSLLLGIETLYMKLSGRAVEGFTTVILSVAFFSGAIILCLGIMGEYLARMYDELKRRPLYIVQEGEDAPGTARGTGTRNHPKERGDGDAGER